MTAQLTGRWCVAGSMDRPVGWGEYAHLHSRQAPVSIDLAAPWRPVDGLGGRYARAGPVDRALLGCRIGQVISPVVGRNDELCYNSSDLLQRRSQ